MADASMPVTDNAPSSSVTTSPPAPTSNPARASACGDRTNTSLRELASTKAFVVVLASSLPRPDDDQVVCRQRHLASSSHFRGLTCHIDDPMR